MIHSIDFKMDKQGIRTNANRDNNTFNELRLINRHKKFRHTITNKNGDKNEYHQDIK